MAARKIKFFDTTLRDGEQSPGCSMNKEQKLELARQLARLKVDIIEAGFPIASPGDFEAVKAIAEQVKGPIIAALARTLPADIDRAGEALKKAARPRIHTFIATSPVHMKYKLKKSPDEVIEMAVAGVKRAKKYFSDVEFSAEDACRSDLAYLVKVFTAVIKAGATVINIPDTVGYIMPIEFTKRVTEIIKRVPNIDKVDISVHCHNDLGLATANSLAAVLAGADQVECTINGIGERAGNTSLEEVVMSIVTRPDLYKATVGIKTDEILRTSRLVSSITGVHVQPNKAVVGANAFAHEAGIHQDGVLKERTTYEIMDPKSIGLSENKLIMGKHSGRHAFAQKLKELGYELAGDELNKAYEKFIALADKKKDVSDRDIESLVSTEIAAVEEIYKLVYVQATAGNTTRPTAAVQLEHKGKVLEGAATGDGPVDAAYRAIDSLIKKDFTLVDYVIQSVTGGTDALGEVVVRLSDGPRIFTGRGSSTDIIVASVLAYLNAINKIFAHRGKAGPKATAEL